MGRQVGVNSGIHGIADAERGRRCLQAIHLVPGRLAPQPAASPRLARHSQCN